MDSWVSLANISLSPCFHFFWVYTLVNGRRVCRLFLLWASVLGKDTKKNLRSYPLQGNLLQGKKEQNTKSWTRLSPEPIRRTKKTPHKRGGPCQGRQMALESWDTKFLKPGHLHNSWGSWLTAAGYVTRCSTMHVFPIIQLIIIRCMYSWDIYEQLMSPIATKGYFSTG